MSVNTQKMGFNLLPRCLWFRDVDNTVNFYSTRDEVVANGDGSWKWPLTRKFAWYNQ